METAVKVYKLAEFIANIENHATDFWEYTFESGSEEGWVTIVKKKSLLKGGLLFFDSFSLTGHFRIVVKTTEWKNCDVIKRLLAKLRGKTMKFKIWKASSTLECLLISLIKFISRSDKRARTRCTQPVNTRVMSEGA